MRRGETLALAALGLAVQDVSHWYDRSEALQSRLDSGAPTIVVTLRRVR